MTAPARYLASTLTVQATTSIQQLRHRAPGWQVFSAEHGWLETRFAAVLLAVPAPQAVPLLEQLAPELAALAGSAVMRGCWALLLRFAAPVDLPFDAAFVNQGPLRWIARNSSKPGRSGEETWLLHARAEWSEAHLEEDPESVAAALLYAFGQLGGPTPQEWTAHRWRYADTEPALAEGCAWRPEIGLGLCGDWLNGGKVEGAWRSGRMLAERVLRSFARC
jgi:predicted NAD/FAD-dependent oxidoreductase